MDPFTYTSSPSHVVFGSGAIHQLRAELLRLGANRPLIVTGPRQARDAVLIERILNDSTSSQSSPHATADSKHFLGAATIFSDAAAQTPVEVTERVLNLFLVCRADSIISLGGGSAIGLGKALSIRTSTPHIAIPTTYAGSEMTPILGEAFNGKKTTRSDPKILPSAVIYDVDLTVSLPLDMSLTSGVNAMAHAVEALYARDGNPVIRLLAGEGIRVLGKALPELEGEGDKKGVRERLLYGAWLCAMSVAGVGVGVQHKLAHVLGGSFGLYVFSSALKSFDPVKGFDTFPFLRSLIPTYQVTNLENLLRLYDSYIPNSPQQAPRNSPHPSSPSHARLQLPLHPGRSRSDSAKLTI